MRSTIVALSMSILCLSGCSALVSKTEQYSNVSSKEGFNREKSLVIVTRRIENNAQAHQVEVTDNGEAIGLLGVGTVSMGGSMPNQLIWERDPSMMKLKLTPKTMVKDLPSIEVVTEAGKIYEYEVAFKYSPYGLQFVQK